MNIGIIGGSDGLGKTLIYHLKDEFNVAFSGRDHNKGMKVANETNTTYYQSNTELASDSDIVIVSVPIHYTNDVIREVAPYMKEGSLMLDVTSVKEIPSETMREALGDDIEYIPTHPIFGPRTTELDNQVIVLTPDKKGKWYPKVFNYLKNKNMRVIETTAKNHDYMMSIVQVLTHFSFISTASAMEKLKIDIHETEDYESPIYNLMIDVIARIAAQNPFLTYYIQSMNNNGEKIRNAFADAVIELRDAVNSNSEETFVEIVNRATKNLGDIQGALGRSDKAINSLSHEITLLHELKGHEVGLKHIYSGKIHTGILKSVDKDWVVLDNKKQLRTANVEILSPEELYQWKVDNYKHKIESISCSFKDIVNKEVIEKTIANIDNVISVNLVDVYNGPQIEKEHISLTFKVEALNKEAIDEVKSLLTGFGGIIR